MRKSILLLVVAGACSGTPAQPRVRDLTWSAETLAATPRLLRAQRESSGRSTSLLRPVSIRSNGEIVVVADVGDDRIVIFDSTGNVTRSFGARGRGPGELFGVSHVALRDSSLLVGEAHNGRISEFTFGGAFMGTYASPFAAGALGATASTIFSASRSTGYYATLVASASLPVDALRRPAAGRSDPRDRWARMPGHDLIASDSLRTWVFDQGRGLICEYDAPDDEPSCVAFPRQMLDRLREYRDARVARLEETIRMRVEAAPLAKDFVLAGRYLALLLPLPDIPVLLINLTDGTLTPVMTFRPIPDWTRSARSFSWDGHGFLLVGDDGLGRLDLSQSTTSSR